MDKGDSIASGPMAHMLTQEVIDAKSTSTTFWELI